MGGEKEGDWKSSAGSRQAGRDLGACHRSMTWMTSSCLEVAQVHPAAWAGLVCKWPRELCQERQQAFPSPKNLHWTASFPESGKEQIPCLHIWTRTFDFHWLA